MTANELIDLLDKNAGEEDTPIRQAVTMLRQQQEKLAKYELRNIAQCDRIAILEAQVYGGTTK